MQLMQPIHRSLSAPIKFKSSTFSFLFNGDEEQQEENQYKNNRSNDHVALDIIGPLATPIRDARRSRGSSVMKWLAPTLLILVGAKYQVDPHPHVLFTKTAVQLWTFVAAACMYCAILEILKYSNHLYKRFSKVFDFIALVCKLFSITSLLTVLLPSRVSLLVFKASTSLIAFILAVRLIHARCKTKLVSISTKLHAKLSGTTMDNTEQV